MDDLHGALEVSETTASQLRQFSSLIQNNMQLTANWSRSKPEVEFQYGGRLYFETGSLYISAASKDILTKLGLQIDFDLLNAVTSKNRKLEVVFSGRGRHLFQRWVFFFFFLSVAFPAGPYIRLPQPVPISKGRRGGCYLKYDPFENSSHVGR